MTLSNDSEPTLQNEKKFHKFIKGAIEALRLNSDFVGAGANNQAISALKDEHESKMRLLNNLNPDAPFFGRIDTQEGLKVYLANPGHALRLEDKYGLPISHLDVYESTNGFVIISAEALAARPYYFAKPSDCAGLTRKRSYVFRDGLLDFFQETRFEETVNSDEVLQEEVDTFLASQINNSMDLSREKSMRSILSTMTSLQFQLIDLSPESKISLQGGPGTGKTAVALHRLSLIAYRAREKSKPLDNLLLFVGPNKRFVEYAQGLVRDELGKKEIVHRVFTECFPGFQATGSDDSEIVATLKGDPRMVSFCYHAVWDRFYPKSPINFSFENFTSTLNIQMQFGFRARALAEGLSYEKTRLRVLGDISDEIYQDIKEQMFEKMGEGRDTPRFLRELKKEIEQSVSLRQQVSKFVPQLNPLKLLEKIKSDPTLFRNTWRAVLSDDLEPETELDMLELEDFCSEWSVYHSSRNLISKEDIPLLVEMEDLINGFSSQWAHVAVDESQDLTPMQLRCVGKLAKAGGLTLVGDLAQATNFWFYDNWESIWSYVSHGSEFQPYELPFGFRVPRDIVEYANVFRELSGVDVEETISIREETSGLSRYRLRKSSDWPKMLKKIELDLSEHSDLKSVAVISTSDNLNLLSNEISDLERLFEVSKLTINQSKGLEFDAVIVLDPQKIVESEISEENLSLAARKLWVAYTRGTKALIEITLGEEEHICDKLGVDF